MLIFKIVKHNEKVSVNIQNHMPRYAKIYRRICHELTTFSHGDQPPLLILRMERCRKQITHVVTICHTVANMEEEEEEEKEKEKAGYRCHDCGERKIGKLLC